MTARVIQIGEGSGPGRLGRHVEHDEASKAFGVRKVVKAPPPVRPVVWRRLVPAYDQGDLGSCTGQTLAGILSTAPFRHRYRAQQQPVRIYKRATELDAFTGTYLPDDTGSSGLGACKAAKALGLIGSYLHAFGLQDMLAAIQLGSVGVGVNWYDSFDRPDSAHRVALPAGAFARGGHEFHVAELHMEGDTVSGEDLFGCWQSWGADWGDRGRFFVPVRVMDRLLHEKGDVVLPRP